MANSDSILVTTDNKADFAVGFKSGKTVNNVTACFFKLVCPLNVVFLVKASLKLDKNSNLLAVFSGFDECGEKGVLQIDMDGNTVKAGFIPTAARRYEKLRVEPGADALAAIRAVLPKDTADDIYKIILTGETAAAPDLAYLRQSLERDFFALTVTDETVPPHDLWQRVGEDSLAGRFLRRMQRRIESARTEEEKKMLLRAVRCGIAALEGWEARGSDSP